MENILLNSNSNQILKLYDFVLEEGLSNKFDLVQITIKADSFYENCYALKEEKEKEFIVQEIEEFSFYDVDNYKFSSKENNILPNLMMVLSVFKSEFIRKLTFGSKDKMYKDFGDLKRKVSPPVETYEYVSNNKLDITPTNRSYGLLYE